MGADTLTQQVNSLVLVSPMIMQHAPSSDWLHPRDSNSWPRFVQLMLLTRLISRTFYDSTSNIFHLIPSFLISTIDSTTHGMLIDMVQVVFISLSVFPWFPSVVYGHLSNGLSNHKIHGLSNPKSPSERWQNRFLFRVGATHLVKRGGETVALRSSIFFWTYVACSSNWLHKKINAVRDCVCVFRPFQSSLVWSFTNSIHVHRSPNWIAHRLKLSDCLVTSLSYGYCLAECVNCSPMAHPPIQRKTHGLDIQVIYVDWAGFDSEWNWGRGRD